MPAPERQRLDGILPDRRGSWQISADRMRAGIAPAAVGLRARVGGTLKDSNRRLTSPRPAFITQTNTAGGSVCRASCWRSAERRGGKECVSTCRSRGSTYHEKKQQNTIYSYRILNNK